MPDPYQRLSSSALRTALLIFFLLSALLLLAMHALDQKLITGSAPRGIVSFELAGSIKLAGAILAEWGPQGKVYAALSLGLDFLFLIVYALFISLACVLVARCLSRRTRLAAIWGLGLAWGQFVAAVLDAVENLALVNVVLGSAREIWPETARWCAILKFGIVGAGLAYILTGSAILLIFKVKEKIK